MKPLKALIILGHGSKAPEALEEMRDLAAKLQATMPDATVIPSFLSLSNPSLPEAIDQAAQAGSEEIHVLPLFFFSGKHVLEDIPRLIAAAQAKHPGMKLVLREAAGRHPDFLAFLAQAGGFGG